MDTPYLYKITSTVTLYKNSRLSANLEVELHNRQQSGCSTKECPWKTDEVDSEADVSSVLAQLGAKAWV